MAYGLTDYTGLNRLSNAISDYSQGEADAAQQIAALKERAADRRNAMGVMSWVGQQDLSKPENIVTTAQRAGTMLSANPGPQSEKAAQSLHQLFSTATSNVQTPTTPKAPSPQWLDRGTTTVWDVPQPGDSPHKEYKPEGSQWLFRGGKPVYDVPKLGDRPYEKPTARDEAGARQEKMDLQKQKDAYNLSTSLAGAYENLHGKDKMQEWAAELSAKHPNAVASYMAIANNPDLTDEQKSQQYQALGEGVDKELRQKLQIVGAYSAAKARGSGYTKNIEDRGYYIDDNGKLVKGKRPVAVEIPPLLARPQGTTGVQSTQREKVVY